MEKRASNPKDPLKEILCYIQPDKPLAFNFYDATSLDQLRDKEPTSGNKKTKKENTRKVTKGEESKENANEGGAKDEEETPKKENTVEMRYEGPLLGDNTSGTKKTQENKSKVFHQEQKGEQKRQIKIKFKKYTNSLNVSNNKLENCDGIVGFLDAVLPDLTFKTSNDITKVDLLQWIDLSRNKLTCLSQDLAELKFLKILYVHGNNIQEIEKVLVLKKCRSLTNLTLYGNPIDHIKGYRHFIIEMCPILEKFDSAVISEKELDIIKFRGSRYGEVRDKKGNVKKYPKLPEEIIRTIQLAEENNAEKKDE